MPEPSTWAAETSSSSELTLFVVVKGLFQCSFLHMWVSEWLDATHVQMPVETRNGHWIAWSWVTSNWEVPNSCFGNGSGEEQQEPSPFSGLTFDWAKPKARNMLPLSLLDYEGIYHSLSSDWVFDQFVFFQDNLTFTTTNHISSPTSGIFYNSCKV